MHGVVFDALHNQRVPLNRRSRAIRVDRRQRPLWQRVLGSYKSFTVQSKVARAQQIAAAYKITGVPTMAVGGRFMTSGSLTGSHEAMLRTVDQLIVTARADLGKK